MKKQKKQQSKKKRRQQRSEHQQAHQEPQLRLLKVLKSGWARVFYSVTVVAIALPIYDVWFDTAPEISPAGPDASSPFLLPFSVRNPSHIFRMTDVQWTCGIDNLAVAGGGFRNIAIISAAQTEIAPGATVNYRCSIRVPANRVGEARISPSLTYTTLGYPRTSAPLPCAWQAEAMPPRWICGDIH